MDLRQLRYFVAIAKEGSLSKAAAVLSISQSALTRHLQALEGELGVKVLYRNGRGVTLTDAGAKFLDSAEEIVRLAERSLCEMQAMRAEPAGEVSLGMPPMIAEFLTLPLVRRFKERCPRVSLRVSEAISGYVLEWLVTGRVDVAILYNAPARSTIIADPLVADDLFLVSARGQADLSCDRPIEFAVAAQMPLVLPSKPHGLRAIVDAAAAANTEIKPNVVLEVDAMSLIVDLVQGGAGYTLLPYPAVRKRIESGQLSAAPVINPRLSGTWSLALSTQRPANQASKYLYTCIREEVRSLVKQGIWRPNLSAPSVSDGPEFYKVVA